MRMHEFSGWHWLTVIVVTAGLLLAAVVSAGSSAAASPVIAGVVEDTSGAPLSGVTVNVQDPATASTVTSTTTADDGSFSASVDSGTYNVEFIPPSSSGLQSYLATGVTAGSTPLTIILKSATVVQVQGTLGDAQGNVYTSAENASVTFISPLNPGTRIEVNGSGGYSVSLLADQNFTADAYVSDNAQNMNFTGLPVGTLDASQTYNLTLPTAQLNVSVQDSSGNAITGGTVQFGYSYISPLPGMPGSEAGTSTNQGVPLNASGDASVVVPDGITLSAPEIVLTNGLAIPFTLPAISGVLDAYIIFNETTGAVTVDDQPPVVTGSPDRAPNANGWYNAPVTITWTSIEPNGSAGTPTAPPPVTLSTQGADQTVTSAPSCDPAGNCATGTVTGLSIDTTPPTVSVTGVTSGATYTQAPDPGCSTSDSLSGVATDATLTVTDSGTSYTATCSGATDKAGNTAAPVSVTYQVLTAAATATAVNCSPNPVAVGTASTCTATVTDTSSAPVTPTGTVTFSSASPGYFSSSGSCTLAGSGATASCQVTYTQTASGTVTISAGYGGDGQHTTSTGTASVTVYTPLSGNVTCKGVYGGTAQDLTVPAGSTCTLITGTVIAGNIADDGTLTMSGTAVDGDISARNIGPLTVTGPSASIGGNLEVRGGSTVTITGGVTISGGLQIEQIASGTTMNLICGLQLAGNLQWLDNAAPVTIGGHSCPGNTITEDLQVEDNTMPSGYTGPAAIIENNTVNGNLASKSNTPAATVSGNTVGGTTVTG